MKRLKLTELAKSERLEKEALCCIRGGSDATCCCHSKSEYKKARGNAQPAQ